MNTNKKTFLKWSGALLAAIILSVQLVLTALPSSAATVKRKSDPLINNRTYYLQNVYSGKYLEVAGNDLRSNVRQNAYSGGAFQKFRLMAVEGTGRDAYYELLPAVNEKMRVDINNASSKNGSNVQLYKANPSYSQAQRYQILPNGDGSYRLISKVSKTYSKALEVAGPSKKDGANIQIWDYVGKVNQHWILKDISAPATTTTPVTTTTTPPTTTTVTTTTTTATTRPESYKAYSKDNRYLLTVDDKSDAYTHSAVAGTKVTVGANLANLSGVSRTLVYTGTPIQITVKNLNDPQDAPTNLSVNNGSLLMSNNETISRSLSFVLAKNGLYEIAISANFMVDDQPYVLSQPYYYITVTDK